MRSMKLKLFKWSSTETPCADDHLILVLIELLKYRSTLSASEWWSDWTKLLFFRYVRFRERFSWHSTLPAGESGTGR